MIFVKSFLIVLPIALAVMAAVSWWQARRRRVTDPRRDCLACLSYGTVGPDGRCTECRAAGYFPADRA